MKVRCWPCHANVLARAGHFDCHSVICLLIHYGLKNWRFYGRKEIDSKCMCGFAYLFVIGEMMMMIV